MHPVFQFFGATKSEAAHDNRVHQQPVSAPSEWRCEACRIKASGCGLAPGASPDATEAFLVHLGGTRLAHGGRAGDDALVCAYGGAVLNAAEIMVAGASEWTAQMEAALDAKLS